MSHPHPTRAALLGACGIRPRTHTFEGSFGQDSVKDADGQGRIQVNGQTLGKFSAAGERNTYSAKLGDGSATSGDGIRIQNFNLGKAQGGSGYLGIRLDGKQKVALIQGTPAELGVNADNVWTVEGFDPACPRQKTSKFIAAHAFRKSARGTFFLKNTSTNDGWMRRVA
jgi:hypothetical protein